MDLSFARWEKKSKTGLVKLQKSHDSKLREASGLSKLSSPHAGHSQSGGQGAPLLLSAISPTIRLDFLPVVI
jgi:hypothetical protein